MKRTRNFKPKSTLGCHHQLPSAENTSGYRRVVTGCEEYRRVHRVQVTGVKGAGVVRLEVMNDRAAPGTPGFSSLCM